MLARPVYDGPLIWPTVVGLVFFVYGFLDWQGKTGAMFPRFNGAVAMLLGGSVAVVGAWRLVVG